MAVHVVAVVGRSGSGKTRFIEGLIPELRSRGHRVAYVKHCHEGFRLDYPDKDSVRSSQAGARVVVLASPEETATIEKRGSTLRDLTHELASRIDVIVAEGFKSEPVQKIEVLKSGARPVCEFDPNLLAVISDSGFDKNLPAFGHNEIKGVADFLERRIMGGENAELKVDLEVDGSTVDLNDFAKSIISSTVMAMISNLRGVKKPQEIRLTIEKAKGGDSA